MSKPNLVKASLFYLFLNLPFRANFYPMTGLSQTDDDDLLTDLGEGRLGGPLERPTDP